MADLSPLYAICDADACRRAGWPLVDFAHACLDGGARFLQVRGKPLTSQALCEATQQIVEAAARGGALVIVNDRADIALATAAGGVHVGQEDLSPLAVRAVVGASAVVGLSTHTDEQVRGAAGQAVSYLATGPVFGTATKDTGYAARGLDAVRATAALTRAQRVPLVAIGGITLATAAAVIEAGAQSVAVISDLLSTGRPDERVRAFLAALA